MNKASKKDPIRNISDFINWVNNLELGSNDALYRGLSSEEYSLDTSITRRIKKSMLKGEPDDLTTADMWRETDSLINEAKEKGYDREATRRGEAPSTDFELLALLQHKGAATPLMDFTHNPLIALWFACRDNSERNNNGRVIVIQATGKFYKINVRKHIVIEQGIDLTKEAKEEESKKKEQPEHEQQGKTVLSEEGELWRFTPPGFDARILAQSSEFILGKMELEGGDIYDECIIAESKKKGIRQELNRRYGISEESLFQDFSGFAGIKSQCHPIEKTAYHYNQSGMDYLHNEQFGEAVTAFSEAIKLNPNKAEEAEAYYQRGIAYWNKDEYGLAADDFTKAIKLNPPGQKQKLAQIHSDLGSAYFQQGKYKKAFTNFYKAIELNPNNVGAHYNLGIAYDREDEHGKAITAFDKFIEFKPGRCRSAF